MDRDLDMFPLKSEQIGTAFTGPNPEICLFPLTSPSSTSRVAIYNSFYFPINFSSFYFS